MKTRIPAVLAALAIGCSSVVTLASPADAATYAKVIRWMDGDSLLTSRGEVRMIGIDTPEMGACGSKAAKALANRLAPPGSRIRLANPSSVRDKDVHGRLLRYVDRGTVDLGRRQIRAGAKARYDGRDGYDYHPRQGTFRRVDRNNPDYGCGASVASGGGGAYAPVPGTWNCPSNAPIKGNQGSNGWIYHQPWNQYYDNTNPEECFATAAAAEAAGYRAAQV